MSSFVKPLRASPPPAFSLTFGATAAIVTAAAIVVGADAAFALTAGFAVRTLVAAAVGAAAVVWLARRHLGDGVFGAANCVTLLRGALVAPLVGLIGEGPTASLAWFATAIAIVVLALDGVDGRLARRLGLVTPFGARFDMETDTLLMLVLSALSFQFGKAGAWILAAGVLRYAFVGAGRVLPFLRRVLPPSRRRQAVCVVQVAALVACLSPLLGWPWSAVVAALGLAALTWSFALDVYWLARRS